MQASAHGDWYKKLSSGYLPYSFSEKFVKQKGSGYHVIVGALILIFGIGIGLALNNGLITYGSLALGISVIISAFLMIIKQYERAIILRLGKYQRQVGPGVQTRLPF
ncbi:MAG: hypothetical protein ACREAN_02575, partial [Nitrosopumilaceae archaeon]